MCSVKPLSASPGFWIRELTTRRSSPFSPPSSSRRRSKSLSLSSCSTLIESIDAGQRNRPGAAALPEQPRVPAEGAGGAARVLLEQGPVAPDHEGTLVHLLGAHLAARLPTRRQELEARRVATAAQRVAARARKREQLADVVEPVGGVGERRRAVRQHAGDERIAVPVERLQRE